MDPISGSVISDATKRVNSGGIGRTTTEYYVKGNHTYVYEDKFEVKLWEVAAAAGVTALIYYAPAIITAYNPGQLVRSLGDWWNDTTKQEAGPVLYPGVLEKTFVDILPKPKLDIPLLPRWDQDFPQPPISKKRAEPPPLKK